MREIRIGMLGCGTVGQGVVHWLARNGSLIEGRCGVRLNVTRIAVANPAKIRCAEVDPRIVTTDANSVVNDPAVDVVVELIGGTGAAREYVLAALKNGKPVVTANKALLAYHGDELFTQAETGRADIYYEASVAGGIPIIKTLREGLAGNHIQHIYGILNGTCNYILTRMEKEGASFASILAAAQKLGFAEADPALDIDGWDTAHKISILASLAYGEWFGVDPIHVEGIRNLELADIQNAAEAGYSIKLLGIIKLEDGNIQIRVHPALIPESSILAQVDYEYNAVWVRGDAVGQTLYYGKGAGQDPTASAVIADLIDVSLNLEWDAMERVAPFRRHRAYKTVVPMDEVYCRYYLRLSVEDKPSVLARITHVLGETGISIASVHQRELAMELVPVILITHTAKEADIKKALAGIRALDVVRGEPVLLRIEDL